MRNHIPYLYSSQFNNPNGDDPSEGVITLQRIKNFESIVDNDFTKEGGIELSEYLRCFYSLSLLHKMTPGAREYLRSKSIESNYRSLRKGLKGKVGAWEGLLDLYWEYMIPLQNYPIENKLGGKYGTSYMNASVDYVRSMKSFLEKNRYSPSLLDILLDRLYRCEKLSGGNKQSLYREIYKGVLYYPGRDKFKPWEMYIDGTDSSYYTCPQVSIDDQVTYSVITQAGSLYRDNNSLWENILNKASLEDYHVEVYRAETPQGDSLIYYGLQGQEGIILIPQGPLINLLPNRVLKSLVAQDRVLADSGVRTVSYGGKHWDNYNQPYRELLSHPDPFSVMGPADALWNNYRARKLMEFVPYREIQSESVRARIMGMDRQGVIPPTYESVKRVLEDSLPSLSIGRTMSLLDSRYPDRGIKDLFMGIGLEVVPDEWLREAIDKVLKQVEARPRDQRLQVILAKLRERAVTMEGMLRLKGIFGR